MENREQNILDAAEALVRERGYNGFSFREVAKEVGIKSSSVHYHFPSKEDLGAAIAENYTENFLSKLGEPKEIRERGKDPVDVYVTVFRNALVRDKRMCLCGLLGAEAAGLPPKVVAQTRLFFEKNIDWLSRAYGLEMSRREAKPKAIQTLALLEGAMIFGTVFDDVKFFETVISAVRGIRSGGQ